MPETTTIGNAARLVLALLDRTEGLAKGLTDGITQDIASCMPTNDGTVINTNHATFIFGHLSIYPQMIMTALSAEPGDAAVPESYTELFMHGVECKHDPDSTIYPPLQEVLAHFNRAHTAVREHIASLDDESLSKPITHDERMAAAFEDCDKMALFMLHDHYMFHLGQLSTWRRCFGLGSVM
jgi:hypothetical protein